MGVGGVLSPEPYAPFSYETPLGKFITDLNDTDPESLAKFLRAHGVSGLFYNLETHIPQKDIASLINLNADVWSRMDFDPSYRNCFSSTLDNNGEIYYANALTDRNISFIGNGDSPAADIVLTNVPSHLLAGSAGKAESVGRNAGCINIAMDSEMGKIPVGSEKWKSLTEIGVGIALFNPDNILWSRSSGASSATERQQNYLREQTAELERMLPSEGRARIDATRSTLGWDLSSEPFITNFTLGNGFFYNIDGETIMSRQWSNIGLQDYLPSWRFWWSEKMLGSPKDDSSLDANFTWEDAYCGGSSLKIEGNSQSTSILHLFRTKFALKGGDKVTIRYKLLHGHATAKLSLLTEVEEKTHDISIFGTDKLPDRTDWQEMTYTVPAGSLTSSPIEVIALKFDNASELQLLIGQLAICRGSIPAPPTPLIKDCQLISNRGGLLSAKFNYSMSRNGDSKSDISMNNDFNTSCFRIWAQQKGYEPTLSGATSQWAAVVEDLPLSLNNMQDDEYVRFGVQAVSSDFSKVSDIAWTEYKKIDLPIEKISGIEISKADLVVGEPFVINFTDKYAKPVRWRIITVNGYETPVIESSSVSVDIADGLSSPGIYSVETTDEDGKTTLYPSIILVKPDAAQTPETNINLSAPNQEIEGREIIAIENGNTIELQYTIGSAPGCMSQAIALPEYYMAGTWLKESGIDPTHDSFTIGGWISPRFGDRGCALFTLGTYQIRGCFGELWVDIDNDGIPQAYIVKSDGSIITMRYDGVRVTPERWCHVTFAIDNSDTESIRLSLFINGQETHPTFAGETTFTDLKNIKWNEQLLDKRIEVTKSSYKEIMCYFGGERLNLCDWMSGAIDDVTLWRGIPSEEEIKDAMRGFHSELLIPENIAASWTFEQAGNPKFESGVDHSGTFYLFYRNSLGAETMAACLPMEPLMTSGNPFVDGNGWQSKSYSAQWSAPEANIVSITDRGDFGCANISFDKPGIYQVAVTLSNEISRSELRFPLIAFDMAGLDKIDLTDNGVVIRTEPGSLSVEFVEERDEKATATLFDSSGRMVASASGYSVISLPLSTSGVYILRLHTRSSALSTCIISR